MNSPRVSVVIPTCNAQEFLRPAIESVFNQVEPPHEVIVVDDASTDRTRDILREYGNRIAVVERSVNSGTADIPRYDGVEQAKGAYCAFLDADDVWLPGKLGRQVAFMDAHPEIPLCHSYVMVMNQQGEDLHVRHQNAIPSTGIIVKELLRHCFIATSSVMVRREAWLAAQRREDVTGFGTEWDFFLAIARKHPIGFIPEVLAKYRHVSGSVSRRKWRRTPRDIGAKERILKKGLWEGVIPRSGMKKIIAEASMEGAQYWRDRGYAGRAAWFALKAIQYGPLRVEAWGSLAKAVGKRLIGN